MDDNVKLFKLSKEDIISLDDREWPEGIQIADFLVIYENNEGLLDGDIYGTEYYTCFKEFYSVLLEHHEELLRKDCKNIKFFWKVYDNN